jgi:Protein of unknown function (DUF3007)
MYVCVCGMTFTGRVCARHFAKSLHICCISLRKQAKQLKDYENAVIAKRLEELDEDEVRALVEEVEKDTF